MLRQVVRKYIMFCSFLLAFFSGDDETEELTSTQEEDKQVDEVETKKPLEFNDRPLPKAVNFLGEDVDALMISLFDKKRSKYICQQCKIICNIPMVCMFFHALCQLACADYQSSHH